MDASLMESFENITAQPVRPLADVKRPAAQSALCGLYNRIGGIAEALGHKAGIEPAAVLAVFHVESGGRKLTPGNAILRFECNLLYAAWGKLHPDLYRQHFQHGGLDSAPGKAWQNHMFRESAGGAFHPVHQNQASEYAALGLASRLSGEDTAVQCGSIGGCQILLGNYKMLGYATPSQMFAAFQTDERAHVLGFFRFCEKQPAPKAGGLLEHLKARRWREFAKYYNGPGNVDEYSARMQAAYEAAKPLLAAATA